VEGMKNMLPIFVVIVDSDQRFLEIAANFLQKRSGVLVYSALSTSDEILQQATVFEPDILLYNLDNAEPKSLETIKKLRDKFPHITIVVVSPPENQKFKQATIDAGANDFILRYAMNLEFLPAIWSLITMYQQRYGKTGVGTIPARKTPFMNLSSYAAETSENPHFIN
jgi:DNA-binding NarL/FixJ family response regulator